MHALVKQHSPRPADVLAAVGLAAIAWSAAGPAGVAAVLVIALVVRAALPLLRRVVKRTPSRSVYWPTCIGISVLTLIFIVEDPYELTLLGLVFYAALALTGLSLIAGTTGQVSFAHIVFVGVGAYTFGFLADRVGVNVLFGILAAGAAGAIAGLIIGLPAMQIRGQLYLAVATISLAVAFGPLLNLQSLEPYIGGSIGLQVFDYVAFPASMTDLMPNANWVALLALVLLGIGMFLAASLKRTSVGRSMLAVRENETVATSLGIPVRRLKLQVFVLSATYAGASGALLFLLSNRFASPADFDLPQMILLYVVLMLGGSRSLVGALLGGFLLVYGYQSGLSEAVNGALTGSFRWNLLFAAVIVVTAAALIYRGRRHLPRAAVPGRAQLGRLQLSGPQLAGLVAAVVVAIGLLTLLLRWVIELRELKATGVLGAVAGIVLIVATVAFPDGIAGGLNLSAGQYADEDAQEASPDRARSEPTDADEGSSGDALEQAPQAGSTSPVA